MDQILDSVNLSSIRQRIDWVLFQEPTTLREMVTELRSESIEVVIPSGKGSGPYDYIYVSTTETRRRSPVKPWVRRIPPKPFFAPCPRAATKHPVGPRAMPLPLPTSRLVSKAPNSTPGFRRFCPSFSNPSPTLTIITKVRICTSGIVRNADYNSKFRANLSPGNKNVPRSLKKTDADPLSIRVILPSFALSRSSDLENRNHEPT
jgi:hypothetical protein